MEEEIETLYWESSRRFLKENVRESENPEVQAVKIIEIKGNYLVSDSGRL